MTNIIFTMVLLWISWKIFVFGIKAAWGIAKILCTVLLLPLFLVGLIIVGLISLAVPILVIPVVLVYICGLVKG